MRLSVSAQFTLKDTPEGYLGVKGEHYNFGKDETWSLDTMAWNILTKVFDYYAIFGEIDELNASLDRIRSWLQATEFLPAEGLAAKDEGNDERSEPDDQEVVAVP
jgi:hypothetical protein